jgi:hypothetical protein
VTTGRPVVRNCDGYLDSPELLASLGIDEAAARIAAPTLIIRGDTDELAHPLPHATRLHELIRHSRLWIAPDSASLITRQWPTESLRMFSDFVLDVSEPLPRREALLSPEQLELLAQVELFAGLRRSALISLASMATSLRFQAEDVVFARVISPTRSMSWSGAFSASPPPLRASRAIGVRSRCAPGVLASSLGRWAS